MNSTDAMYMLKDKLAIAFYKKSSLGKIPYVNCVYYFKNYHQKIE